MWLPRPGHSRPCSFRTAGCDIHTGALSCHTRGPIPGSLPNEEPSWRWILQPRLFYLSHWGPPQPFLPSQPGARRHCGAEELGAFSKLLTCSTMNWLSMLLGSGVVGHVAISKWNKELEASLENLNDSRIVLNGQICPHPPNPPAPREHLAKVIDNLDYHSSRRVLHLVMLLNIL